METDGGPEPGMRLSTSALTDTATLPALSVVIPAYNESRRLPGTLKAIRDYADQTGKARGEWEVVVIDDGSTDGTAELVGGFDGGRLALRLLRNSGNSGKGFSVRRGVLEAAGHLVLMSDADMSTPISELEKLLPWIEMGYDVVIGSRDMPASQLRPPQPLKRRLMGKIFRDIRRCLILGHLRDTQCGFKLFTRSCAEAVFPLQREEGFGFDPEILALAERFGYEIKEVGVLWGDNPSSRVRPLRDAARMLKSVLLLRLRMRSIKPDLIRERRGVENFRDRERPSATSTPGGVT